MEGIVNIINEFRNLSKFYIYWIVLLVLKERHLVYCYEVKLNILKNWLAILKERSCIHYLQFKRVHCIIQRIGEIDENIISIHLGPEIRRENNRIKGFNCIEVIATRGALEANVYLHALWVCKVR